VKKKHKKALKIGLFVEYFLRVMGKPSHRKINERGLFFALNRKPSLGL
jgi:hypothetical protein